MSLRYDAGISELLANQYRSDGNIRYYEYENDKFQYLSEYKSVEPQRGIAFVPKRGVNTHENEVMRCYKTVNDAYIEPVSFIVPRRAEVFQNDIYPPAVGAKAAMSSADYFGGKAAALPPKITMESLYDGEAPVEVPAEKVSKPAEVKATPAPAQTKTPESAPSPVKAEPTPSPISSRAPTSGSIKDNQQSMASAASRFADKDEEESSDDASSFEEVSKPFDRSRSIVAEQKEEKTPPATATIKSSVEATRTSSAPAPEPVKSVEAAPEPVANSSAATASDGVAPATAKGAAEGIKGVLQEIKSMLAQQAGQIESLTQEVAHLKTRLGDA